MAATPTDRPQRADARRNRARIVAAAKDAFAAGGLAAQMEDVARRAGVGVGTLYRHFPTKDALIAALVVDHMEQIAAETRRLAESEDDAWTALERSLWFGAELQAKDRALAEVFGTQPAAVWIAAQERSGLGEIATELLARAREQGAVRPDARVDDIHVVMCGLGRVLETARECVPVNWRRYMRLALDGLRATGAEPLPD